MNTTNPFDRIDTIHRESITRLAATLDMSEPNGVPPLWHWVSFLDSHPTSTLGPDGHPRMGGLIPEPPHPRRMFAGGRMRWVKHLPVNTPVRRTASVGDIIHKEGSRGPLAFTTIELTYTAGGETLAVEEQDIVYLPESRISHADAPARTAPSPRNDPEPAPDLEVEAVFAEVALFRFSAMTFNTHRIHYDLPYAKEVEGYPGLVVHGPLLVIRLLDLVREAYGEQAVETLAFRAVAPAFCGSPVRFVGWRTGQDVRLEARSDGRTLTRADVKIRTN